MKAIKGIPMIQTIKLGTPSIIIHMMCSLEYQLYSKCVFILYLPSPIFWHSNNENVDLVIVGCIKNITQTAVMDMYNLGLLNIIFFHQCNTKNTTENNDMIINGVTMITNTLNIALDEAKSLTSVV